ncbi:unnamed protein product, partial [Pocillopora meandrina]
TEVELILERCGCFQKPANLSDMTICPVHRAKLDLGWRRTGNLCTIPEVVSGHCKELRKAPALEKGKNLFQSMKIFELSKQLVPMGSGICVKCRKMLSVYKERAPEKCQMTAVSEIAETLNKLNLVDHEADTDISLPVPITDTECKEGRSKRASLYVPDEDSQESEDDINYVQGESLKQLNRFLQLRDTSPVRHVLSVPWNVAQSRTKRRYLRKAEQCASAVMEVLAPEDSNCLTRRQILSILADKLSFKEVQELIPTLTSYRSDIARHHTLLHGRAEPIPRQENRRMKVDQGKLEDFISFITSSHVIQDVPFGERLLKLSTGEVIKTPNVIRMMIPGRIVQQYQQYCSERGFEPMSRRTLHRVLDECSTSVRKSFQGLDNFSSQGAEAFDDLDKVVDKLVDCGKTEVWAKE